MKKILITGFKPYGKFKINITEKIIKKIQKKKNVKKIIFPVIFKKELFVKNIRKLKPDIIISLGQCSQGKLLRIERKAKNQIKLKKGKIKKINKKGPKEYLVNLKFKKLKESRTSYDAGTYVCNFLIYTIMDYIKKKNLASKFAFIHIPKDFQLKIGVKIIEKLLNQL